MRRTEPVSSADQAGGAIGTVEPAAQVAPHIWMGVSVENESISTAWTTCGDRRACEIPVFGAAARTLHKMNLRTRLGIVAGNPAPERGLWDPRDHRLRDMRRGRSGLLFTSGVESRRKRRAANWKDAPGTKCRSWR